MASKEKALKEKEGKKPSDKTNNTVNGTGGTPIHVNTLQVHHSTTAFIYDQRQIINITGNKNTRFMRFLFTGIRQVNEVPTGPGLVSNRTRFKQNLYMIYMVHH